METGIWHEGPIHMDPDQFETHYILSLSRKYIEDKILLIHS